YEEGDIDERGRRGRGTAAELGICGRQTRIGEQILVHALLDRDRLGRRAGPEARLVPVDGLRGEEGHRLRVAVQVDAVLDDVVRERRDVEAAIGELGEERQVFDLCD